MILNIIIPCFNEKDTIEEIINEINKSDTLNCNKEIIVIDDCSTDGSSKVLEEILKNNKISKLIKNEEIMEKVCP